MGNSQRWLTIFPPYTSGSEYKDIINIYSQTVTVHLSLKMILYIRNYLIFTHSIFKKQKDT